jgi:hypothetical protein
MKIIATIDFDTAHYDRDADVLSLSRRRGAHA